MAARIGMETIVVVDNERALLAFLRAAAASLEGVEVIEQASPGGDRAANGLAEVGVREVKAQTRVQGCFFFQGCFFLGCFFFFSRVFFFQGVFFVFF